MKNTVIIIYKEYEYLKSVRDHFKDIRDKNVIYGWKKKVILKCI